MELICQALKDKGVYWHVFPTYREAKNAVWRDPNMLFNILPAEFIQKQNDSELVIYLRGGSIIQLIGADNPASHLGSGPIGVVLDEFEEMKVEMWRRVVEPILRANEGWCWFIGTPKGKNHLFEVYQRGLYPNSEWKSWLLPVSESGIFNATQLANAKISMSSALFNQEMMCFVPKTNVLTIDGVKYIKDVKVGDLVLTHTNRYKKVIGILKREYDGEVNEIKSYGNNKAVICTPEHPFRITDGKVNIWKQANELKLSNGKGHDNVADRITFCKPMLSKKKFISDNLAVLIAWFISEGSINDGTVQFALNEKETKYIEEIDNAILKEFNNKTIKTTNQGCTLMRYSNYSLVYLLSSLCGVGAKNKKIPLSLLQGHEQLVYDTLIKGDGCNIKKYVDSFVTISKTLAYQMQLLANSLSYVSSVNENQEGFNQILGRQVILSKKYTVLINKKPVRKSSKLRVHKYNISASLIANDKKYYKGLVYNLQVQQDNSYTANGRVVHNCEFLEGEGSIFRGVRDVMTSAPMPPNPKHIYVMGVDLAKVTDYTVVVVYDRQNNQQVYQNRWRTIEWPFQKKRIIEISRHYNNALVVLDATGLGDPIADDLIRMGVPVEPYKITEPSKKELIEKLSIWIEQGKLKMLPVDETAFEFDNYSYEIGPTGKIRYQALEGFNDDIVISHALAVWSLQPLVLQIPRKDINLVQRAYKIAKKTYESEEDTWADWNSQ